MELVNLQVHFLILLYLLSSAFCWQCRQERPNIVIMLMDDMGWGDLGVNGDPTRETINLDRMAREGMLFTDFYAGNPLCSPSRAALLTGRLPIRNGFYTINGQARNAYVSQDMVGGISTSEILISQLLNQVGYRNKLIGKWHLGHSKLEYNPMARNFHEFFGTDQVHLGPFDNRHKPNVAVYRNWKMIGRYYDNIYMDPKNRVANLTQLFTEDALDFMQRMSSKRKPFFLYWAPDTLHAPTYRSWKYVGRSVKNSTYGDALIEIDEAIGRILDFIRYDSCLHNNTLVFFTSDNGASLSDKPDGGWNGPLLCGKQTQYEGGMRVPAIAWWPGKIKSRSVSHSIASVMDFFQTIANLAEVSIPNDRFYDSNDLSQVLFEGKVDENKSMFYYRGDTLMALRHGPYKAHYWTLATPSGEISRNIDYCLGQRVPHLTTDQLTSHLSQPILFHLKRDLGERYPIDVNTIEYKKVITMMASIYEEHILSLVPAKPQLNLCDLAMMEWSPRGCHEINMCLTVPKSAPYFCSWTH